jgi:hypothetical protein
MHSLLQCPLLAVTLRRPNFSRTCSLVCGGMSGWTHTRGLLGPSLCLIYLVKSAARRVLLLGLRARDSGFSMVHGHQPRLWPGPDGSGGLAALEHRWQALWSHHRARLRVPC